MPDSPWRRGLLLILLGMGAFFLLAALLALIVWLTVGNWRSFLVEIAFVATLATIPAAYYLWTNFVAHRL